jgi:3-methyladenine DNA glycosylase AlkC
MSESTAFKDHFNEAMAWRLGRAIQSVSPSFDTAAFVAHVSPQLPPLELKARVVVFAEALRDFLPADYPEAIHILLQILGAELEAAAGMFVDDWLLMPVAYFVEAYGLDHFEESVAAMYEITKRHTSEFTIRPFLLRYPDQLLPILHEWTGDPSPHVRRLVSEGTRPRLPWAMRLRLFMADPVPTLALLEKLKDDPSEYVRRSVANHLNDIAKDHPARVIDTCRRWQVDASKGTSWIIRHALRTLVKDGHPDALALLGYGPPHVRLEQLTVTPAEITMGESVTLAFTLHNETAEPQNLLIDYIVHHVKANGQTSPKVFKLTTRTLPAGEAVAIQKAHSFRPVTTRRYYPGEHGLSVQVNGRVLATTSFLLNDRA